MSTAQQVGGYTYRQQIAALRRATKTARRACERLLTEQPGPTATAVLLAHVGLALGEAAAATEELDRIGQAAMRERCNRQT